MFTVTISSKGQIVLPRAVRQELGLQEGDKLSVMVEEKSVRLTPVSNASQQNWRRWRGVLAGTDALSEHLAEHAEEVNREHLS